MPGDWIKMRTDLYRDPKVCRIADLLMDADGQLARYVDQNCQRDMTVTRNVTRNATVGALVTVWGVTRQRGKRDGDDLLIRHATLETIDDISEIPGFGHAMASVGWAVQDGETLVLPHFFEEYNVEPAAEQKEKNAERQRRYREKRNALRNVTNASQSNAREEKRREEKNTTPPTRAGAREEFRQTWNQTPGAVAVDQVTFDQIGMSAGLVADEQFQRAYPLALAKFPLRAYSEPMTLTQFLREGVMGRIMAGDYDKPWGRGSPSGNAKPSKPQLPKLAEHEHE